MEKKSKERANLEEDEWIAPRPIILQKVRIDTDTSEVQFEMDTTYKGQTVSMTLLREEVNKMGIKKLARFGADVIGDNAEYQVNDLLQQEENLEPEYIHKTMGWHGDGFNHYECIGGNSTYIGDFDVSPQGSLQGFLDVMRNEIYGYTPLELIAAIGYSSAIVGYIGPLANQDTLFAHLFGDSTQGKTTAVRVAVSPFGAPVTYGTGRGDGLIITWNGTKNAIIAKFRGNFGVPLAIDEASMGSGDLTDLIYQVAMGREKDRLNSSSATTATAEWRTTVISTAEHSLLTKSKRNTGLRVRLMEFGNIQWTKDASHAQRIYDGLTQNCGLAGRTFVEHIQRLGREEVRSIWNGWRQGVLQELDGNQRFSERVAGKIALALTAAELANAALGMELNLDSISDFLLQMEKDASDNRDIGGAAYETLKETLIRQRQHFTSGRSAVSDTWGKVVVLREKITEVFVLPEKFRKIMEAAGFEDVNVILKRWKEMGLLDAERDKNTRKKVIWSGGPQVAAICVHILDDADEEEEVYHEEMDDVYAGV